MAVPRIRRGTTGLPALLSAGVVAGLAVWLVGGGVAVAALAVVATVTILRARRHRAGMQVGLSGKKERGADAYPP